MYRNVLKVYAVLLNIHCLFCVVFDLPENCQPAKQLGDFRVKENIAVNCEYLNVTNLTETIQTLTTEHTFTTLILTNSHLTNLPEDAFQNVIFKRLILMKFDVDILLAPFEKEQINSYSEAVKFSETPLESKSYHSKTSVKNNPFIDGLKNNLVTLEIRFSRTVYGWDFKSLHGLKKLDNLIIEDSSLITLKSPLMAIASKGLRYLSLRNSKLKYLDSHSLHKTGRLEWLNLSQNLISELEFNHITNSPDSWSKLWYFDLSANKLKSLPPNIFAKFKNLKELHLEENRLVSMDQKVFEPIWSTLQELWISNNDFNCDNGNMCWLLFPKMKKDQPRYWSSAKCLTRGENKTLYQLSMETSIVFGYCYYLIPERFSP